MKTQNEKIIFRGYQDIPSVPITLGTTLVNLTGSWKYLRPVYHYKTAPCNAGCPNGNDIEAVMYLLSQNHFEAAWERLLWENPFPSITGRVCYHPCESACNRREFDTPLAIHNIERFVGDYGLRQGLRVQRLREQKKATVAIVGAGPAGLAAAYHLARLGYHVTIYEAMPEPGGVLRYGIPEYRLPKDILRQEIQRVCDLGVLVLINARVGKNVSQKDLQKYDAVFLAIGVEKSRKMNIPGENLDGVLSGLAFLRKLNSGEKVKIGKKVAVIGGGNTAMDAARSAVRLGKKVQILYRRSREEMPAIEDEINEALAEGVELKTLVAPVKVMSKNGKVTGLEMVRMQLGEPDESGRRRPVPIKDSNFRIEVDTVITAIGEEADFSFLPEELHRGKNVISIDQIGHTHQAKVFAGGDIVDQPHTVVDAIASGKRAAMAIDMFLRGRDLTAVLDEIRLGDKGALSMQRYVEGGNLPQSVDNRQVVRFHQINTDYFEPASRIAMPEREIISRIGDFGEVSSGYTEAMALAEAGRCFNCGVCNECDNCLVFCPDFAVKRNSTGQPYTIDYNYCKGCGICAHECPRHAITMVREGVGGSS
ncbi:MAG: NAD(P)-binding protein [candidate division KSB1 bacterium]|nr:NAD(P)-binding protein [candidate division KSB1 bacterium]MDZ7303525.1 NAD(P)-binding protein [candidate division KSB1 bacterium]MDZ7312673.1 NAD(P)-binding protein [candidate division KSB1 bacterium]